ncbi:hypothetical protein Lfu02_42750 [Longispora fulva]|uniref:Peptidoglycan recognition protein family domain-containing protein n=1 Tax=Longispora fulva TaxID=619741 RepID=A0A8J7GI09_9ACTN|nr:peptidoglycan recognition family protein [Longispora fulva]MBG6136733.1 hypothetical protein [Longispora fulva]GIG59903.1 hypothetical protein Lfu02_42750 [Longispora fulva]
MITRRAMLAAATGAAASLALPLTGRANASPGQPYLDRASWGADEALRFGSDGVETWPPALFATQTLTVHHTVTANDDPDPAATVRAIYRDHAVVRGWGDIGYHLVIDGSGQVFEGRWSGGDHLPVFGDGAGPGGRPLMVNGGHVAGFNAGNIGVALLGDLSDRMPSPAARRSLVAVLAGLAVATGLDPLGTTRYVNPISGATATVDTISGHRNWQPTGCPGDRFYPELAALRRDVARLVPRPGP